MTWQQKKKPPQRSRFRGFSPALLCGRKSRVLLHANYLARVSERQAVKTRLAFIISPDRLSGALRCL